MCLSLTLKSSQSHLVDNSACDKLYQDDHLRSKESNLLVMTFSKRHGLSGVATDDLFKLISLQYVRASSKFLQCTILDCSIECICKKLW